MTPDLEEAYFEMLMKEEDTEACWAQSLRIAEEYWSVYIQDAAPHERHWLRTIYQEMAIGIQLERDAWRRKPENQPRPSGLSPLQREGH